MWSPTLSLLTKMPKLRSKSACELTVHAAFMSSLQGSSRLGPVLKGHLDPEFRSQLACSGCGRWVESSRSIPHSSTVSGSESTLTEPSSEESDKHADYEQHVMINEVVKRPIAPLASFCYCIVCKGLVCSLCVSTHLDAMACPQCLSLHTVSAANSSSPSLSTPVKGQSSLSSAFSSTSLSLSALFSNRCKKCSSCPSCNSPSLGLRSLSSKDAPESIKKLFFASQPSNPTASPFSSPTISFFQCSFCRWSSIDAPVSDRGSTSPRAPLTSNLLYAESTAKLISKTLFIERESSNTSHFSALVQERRNALSPASTTPQPSAVSRTLQFAAYSSGDPTASDASSSKGTQNSNSAAAPSMTASSAISPLLAVVTQRRHDVQEALNHPNRYKFKTRATSPSEPPSATIAATLQLTEEEEATLKQEYEQLDEAWWSNQENPMLYFRPAAREPLAPLHLPASVKPRFLHHASPIARHPGYNVTHETHNAQLQAQAPHPERIPLYPVCSKKCMRCERVLVKPAVDGHTIGPQSGGPDGNAFSALPDFKRRHTALSFTPMIDVKAYDAFEDYKPSLVFDSYNMISLTVSNPPMVPAVHISLYSPNDSDAESQKTDESESTPPDQEEGASKILTKATASSALLDDSICQVDCNGCETWILEDEPIQLEDEGDLPEPASWLSHPGVPGHLELLEADTNNPAISSRKSRQVTMVVLVMPDLKKFEAAKLALNKPSEHSDQAKDSKLTSEEKIPTITCEMMLKVSWPSPTDEQPDLRHELISPFRINLSKLFEVIP